jgi:F-type H+-transporting ATPase subunit a
MKGGLLLGSANPLEHVVQHPYLRIDNWFTVLSNQIVMQILAAILLILIVPWAIRRSRGQDAVGRLVPSGVGNFFEGICQFLRTQVAQPAMGPLTDRFIKYIWTLFFFLLFCNIQGLFPFDALLGIVGVNVRVGGTATANIWVDGTLAVCSLVMIVGSGLRHGGTAYLAHFCPGPWWLAWLLIPVEIIGLAARIFALAVRLFANMVSGHVLLAVLLSFIGLSAVSLGRLSTLGIAVPVVLGSVAINLLEIFVAFLHAFIFTFLTALFIGEAVSVHHEEHGH